MSNNSDTNRPIAESAIISKYPELVGKYNQSTTLTGTVELQAAGVLVGTGSLFLTELSVGDIISIQDSLAVYKIASITDDLNATIEDTAADPVAAGKTFQTSAEYTISIGETLDLVAAQGRLYWYLLVDCSQDVVPIVDYLTTVLDGQGYTITSKTEATYNYISIFIPPVVTA